ncbi:MAG: prephenate dehydrogenase/arogenate dehydrogenase family protein [Gemmatimonadota bacterium]|nr:prephenate dehydrogenase/arogenate dehydrogenase family protein [Gemmatimonadota bacterium]
MTTTTLPPHVGIIGLGLMGGSLARDLVSRHVRVTAFDPVEGLDGVTDSPSSLGIRLVPAVRDVMDAPVIVLAVPVNASIALLDELHTIVTPAHTLLDVGSTKRAVVAHAASLGIGARFVGCHPFAGDHRSGWRASRTGLFAGATVFVCPAPESAADTVDLVESLWLSVGAVVRTDDPAAHDRRMALASHLPHLLSVALALTLCDAGVPHAELGPGGRDVARLAGGSPEMWVDIVAQNRAAIAAALDRFDERLHALRLAVRHPADCDLPALLAMGRDWHGA